MGAAVDAAPERPVTAAAGYRAAEAKHGRDHVLTQRERNHEGDAWGTPKVTGATDLASKYGPDATAAAAGARHLPADLDVDPDDEDHQGGAEAVAVDDTISWGSAQSDVEEDATEVDLRSFHPGQEPHGSSKHLALQNEPAAKCGRRGCGLPCYHPGLCSGEEAKGPRPKRPSARLLEASETLSLPATHPAKGMPPSARKAQPVLHKSDADTPAMPERVARRLADEEGLELPTSSNATGFKGVYRTAHAKAKPFRAQVTAGRRSKLIGYYSSAAEAALAHARLGPDARVAAAAEAAEATEATEAAEATVPRRQASTEDAAAALLQLITGDQLVSGTAGTALLTSEPSAAAPSASACTALLNMRRPDTCAAVVKAAPLRRAKADPPRHEAPKAPPADTVGRGTSGMRKWTAAETEHLRGLVGEHTDAGGYPRWANIAQGLPGRNAQESRCRWQRVRNSDRQSSAKRRGLEREEAAPGVKRVRGAGGLAAAEGGEEEWASKAEVDAEVDAEHKERPLEALKLKGKGLAAGRSTPPPCTRSPSSVTDTYLQPAPPA